MYEMMRFIINLKRRYDNKLHEVNERSQKRGLGTFTNFRIASDMGSQFDIKPNFMTNPKNEKPEAVLGHDAPGTSITKEIDRDEPIKAITEDVSRSARLTSLRETHEVIEEDCDLVPIFEFVRSDVALTKKDFLKLFPSAKALVITQRQLWEIEDCAEENFLSYITATGEQKHVSADGMEDEPLVLFVEDLG